MDSLIPSGSGPAINDVVCPSTNLCLAADANGEVFVSTEPAVTGSWHEEQVDPGASILSLKCSSASFCYGFDGSGNVLISTDPAAGPSSWRVHRVGLWSSTQHQVEPLLEMTCPSESLCVADDVHRVFVSTDPTAANPPGRTESRRPSSTGASPRR